MPSSISSGVHGTQCGRSVIFNVFATDLVRVNHSSLMRPDQSKPDLVLCSFDFDGSIIFFKCSSVSALGNASLWA